MNCFLQISLIYLFFFNTFNANYVFKIELCTLEFMFILQTDLFFDSGLQNNLNLIFFNKFILQKKINFKNHQKVTFLITHFTLTITDYGSFGSSVINSAHCFISFRTSSILQLNKKENNLSFLYLLYIT